MISFSGKFNCIGTAGNSMQLCLQVSQDNNEIMKNIVGHQLKTHSCEHEILILFSKAGDTPDNCRDRIFYRLQKRAS